jgi:hypothetical protein
MLNLKLARFPTCSPLPSRLYLDHSHGPRARASYLAALPSTRAIETRSLPRSLAAAHRGFAFYVAFPKHSIPYRDVFYVADLSSSVLQVTFCPERSARRVCPQRRVNSVEQFGGGAEGTGVRL